MAIKRFLYKPSPKKYYTYDMAGTRKYFSTKIQANMYRKRVHDRTAIWLRLYKT